MTRLPAILALVATLPSIHANPEEPTASRPAPLDWNRQATSPRSRALELASDAKTQGYTLRDGFWSGTLEKGKPVILSVHLFAGNDYRFSAANLAPGSKIQLSVFDRWGYLAAEGESAEGNTATASLSAIRSDIHHLRLELTEGDKAETCMVYSYK